MKSFIPNLAIFLIVLVMCSESYAAPCAIGGACPQYVACLYWDAAKDESGALVADAQYELSLNSNPFPLITGLTYSFPVPKGQSLKTSDKFSIVTVAKDGTRSAAYSCDNSVIIAGPSAAPLPPSGLRIGK